MLLASWRQACCLRWVTSASPLLCTLCKISARGENSGQSRVSHESALIKCCPLQGQGAAGTSSFGMSGVNAHAVLCPSETQGGAEQQRSLIWQRARHWFAPAQHAMLALCAKSGDNIIIVARLGCASMAYLHDHQVSCSAHNQSQHLLEGFIPTEPAFAYVS